MEGGLNDDNDGLDPSEEYSRNKKSDNDDHIYFPQEESEPLHFQLGILMNLLPTFGYYSLPTSNNLPNTTHKE